MVDTGEKKDARGRKLVKAQQRAALLAAYHQSGLTQKEYAAREGVKYSTLTGWLFAERRRAVAKPPRFQELRLPPSPPPSNWAMELTLPNGVVIRAKEAMDVTQLVRLLASC